MKTFFILAFALLASPLFAQEDIAMAADDLALVDDAVHFELKNKEGVVTISYSSAIPQDIELQFLTRSGSILWSKMLYGFEGKQVEKLDYLVPEGDYITRVYHSGNQTTKRIQFRK